MIIANSLISPGIGLIFWTTVIFLTLLVILRLVAWKPIMAAIRNREESIQNALNAADKAREEMEKLEADNQKILKEARHERDMIMDEARNAREKLIAEARERAGREVEKMMESARLAIENEKEAAVTEIRNQVADLSLKIAEKVLKEKLAGQADQEKLIQSLLDDLKVN